jgi:hypothetical protein
VRVVERHVPQTVALRLQQAQEVGR